VKRRRVGWLGVLAATWLVASVSIAGYALAGNGDERDERDVLGPGPVTIELDVENSRFAPTRIEVRQHTTATFEIVNDDPITHEFIVGGDEAHARHESGNHAQHGTVPGEVSVGPGETGTTSYTFHSPGRVLYACHLPGHFAYGMVGSVVVRPAA
jgi:uncharacterized cupredoxin-like copper-binding protein